MNNRRRALLIIYILSIAVSAVLFSWFMSNNVHDTEYTSYTKSIVTNEGVYFSENMENYALLYKMNDRGRVLDILNTSSIGEERIHAMYIADGNLYVSTSKSVLLEDGSGDKVDHYRIYELDSNLKTKRVTMPYVLNEGFVLSAISIGKSGICTTAISSDGKQVKVVALPIDAFYDEETAGDNLMLAENVMVKNAEQGRFFVSAIYENGALQFRTDKDHPLDAFAENETVSAVVSNMKLSVIKEIVMYRTYFAFWIALTVVWLIVVSIIYRTLENANRFFYSYILLEVILAIVVGGCIFFAAVQYRTARTTEHTRFGIISLQGLAPDTGLTTMVNYNAEGYFDSEIYRGIQSKMADFVDRNSNIFYDVFIVRLADGRIVTSASGRNNESAIFVYGNAVAESINTLYSGASMFADNDLVLSGQKCKVVGIADSDFIANYALMGVINDVNISSRFTRSNMLYLAFFIFVFAVGSAILTVIYFVQTRDFKYLEDALKETALGRTLPERPLTVGADIKNMWDSLTEINKRVDKINYTKIKVLEAYYRFAPKNLEYAFGKESIIDVKNENRTTLSGSLLTVRIPRAEKELGQDSDMSGTATVIERLDLKQQDNDCIIVGNNSDLSKLQILFLNSSKGMVDFAAEIIHDSNMSGSGFNSAFIYYDDFDFGIVGNNGLAFTYIESDKSKDLSVYSKFFNRLHLGLVITEYIRLRDYQNKSVRYIGFVIMPGISDRINLYEVMDACKQGERQSKLRTMRQFDKAFEMYEQKDFYLARNLFSDLLKESPDDELARWYLFESEKYLNEGVEDETTFGALHL